MIKVIERSAWAISDSLWKGEIELGSIGANLCVIFNRQDIIGGGPRLHTHPYAETFIMREGRALFTVGDEQVIAEAGQILVAPANVPHKFANLGPGPMESIDIHEAGHFITTWLE